MFITVLMWACLIILSALALGFAVCTVLMALGVFLNLRKDPYMSAMFAIMTIVSMAGSAIFIFAALAMGRNLL